MITPADVLREFPGARVELPSLREYQRVACRRVVDAMATHRRILLVSCVGSGKTSMLSAIVCQQEKPTVWLAHRQELIAQAKDRLASFGLFPPVISVQSFLAGNRPPAELVIEDEAHHFVSDEWRQVDAHYNQAVHLGASATPCRADGRGLHNGYDRMVIAARVSDMVDDGWLVPLEIKRPTKTMNAGALAMRPVDAYLQHARDRVALVFSPNVNAAKQHAQEFIDAGIAAEVCDAKTPADVRAAQVERVRNGSLRVLVSVAIFTEGADLPAVSCIILARTVGSLSLYDQICGRGLRTHPGKEGCLLLDLTGTSWSHGHPADDRVFSLEGRGVRKGCDDWVDPQTSCRVCGAPTVPGEACLDCGAEPKKMEAPKVVLSPLVKYAAMRALDPSKQAAWLAKQVAVMREKGYRRGWLYFRFKTVFGFPPSAELLRQAGA